MSEAPKPGLYPGTPFADYFLWDAVASHELNSFAAPRTPAHARELILHPKDQTKALATGHALHACLLEPERFELDYFVAPKLDKRFKANKEKWAELEAANQGRTPLAEDEYADFVAMREAVLSHPVASELLKGRGASELSIVWPEGDRPAKGRLDRVAALGGYGFVVDVKTAEDASERAFQKAAAAYGYFRQIAWYRRGLNALRPSPRRCAFIVVEKARPFCVAVYEVDDRALDQANRENEAALETYRRCIETGSWPGYDQGLGLIDYPAWAVDKLDL